MIKAEELRIGNWVWNDVQNLPVKVDIRILNQQYSADRGIGVSWLSVPLTEEILSKCPEFKLSAFSNEVWYLRSPESQFHIAKFNGRFIFRGLGMSVFYVDTLHHLQNLVYVNTLKELEVNI